MMSLVDPVLQLHMGLLDHHYVWIVFVLILELFPQHGVIGGGPAGKQLNVFSAYAYFSYYSSSRVDDHVLAIFVSAAGRPFVELVHHEPFLP